MTGQLGHVLHVQYPKRFTSTVGEFKWLLDIWSLIFSPACAGLGGFYDKWWLRIVCQPVLCGGIVYAIYKLDRGFSKSEARDKARNTLIQNLLRAIFLCYPGVCNVAFSTLDCRYDSVNTKVLVDDDRLSCDDSTHTLYWWASVCVIVVFGFGAPVYGGIQIWKKARQAEMELSKLSNPSLIERATAELLPPENDHAELAWQRNWRSFFPFNRCCIAKAEWKKVNKQWLQWNKEKAVRQMATRVQDAFIESTSLINYTSLTEAYHPNKEIVWWESIDMLRKLFLVGVVVLAGRGSVAQNMCSSILSFFFFAMHIKMWPMKMAEDNILRATCEFHVFWTITTAFVMKSDLKHEYLQEEFYDNSLLISGAILVPGTFVVCMYSKYKRWTRCTRNIDLDTYEKSLIPAQEFVHFSIGLASSSDRENLKTYFETRSSKIEQSRRREEWCAFEKHADFLTQKESPSCRPAVVLALPGREGSELLKGGDAWKGGAATTDEAKNGADDPSARLMKLKQLLKKMVAISRQKGRQPVFEPALVDDEKLKDCQATLGSKRLPGHLATQDTEEAPDMQQVRARISTMREQRQLVDFLEFLNWWDQRHGRHEGAKCQIPDCPRLCKAMIPAAEPKFLTTPPMPNESKANLLRVAQTIAGQASFEPTPDQRRLLAEDGLNAQQAEQLIEFAVQTHLFERPNPSPSPNKCSLCSCCSGRDRIGSGIEEQLLPIASSNLDTVDTAGAEQHQPTGQTNEIPEIAQQEDNL